MCRCPDATLTIQPGREVFLLFLPIYHIYAQMIVQISLHQGDTLTIMAKFDFKHYLQAIQKYKVDTYTFAALSLMFETWSWFISSDKSS